MDLQDLKKNSTPIIIALVAVLGLIFILQNFEQTSFQFLLWTIFSGPKWLVILGFFLGGMAVGYILGKKKNR